MTDGKGREPLVASPAPAGGGGDGNSNRASAPPGVLPRLRYLPGLDGLRALAVVAVLLYHADIAWIPGGFLGVDVFFVISGYLITSLLLSEWSATGTIGLRRFWGRRARRLLPGLFALLVVVGAVVVTLVPDQEASLGGEVAAAVTYSTNWYQIFHEVSYFDSMGRPSLFRHLWSLAVEEQFYVLWPLLFAGGMALLGRRRFPRLVLAGALASAALMAAWFVPGDDPSRIYYGTDTRAAGLLIGSALAFVWVPGRLSAVPRRSGAVALTLAALVSLGGLTAAMLLASEYGSFLYQGGFLVVALLSGLLVTAASHPGGIPGKVFGWAPLVWLGVRSYAIYLWHWPVFMLTRPHIDVPFDGPGLLVLRLGATLLLADLSYRLIEQPFRRGTVRWERLRPVLRLAGAGSVLSVGLLAGAVVLGSWPVFSQPAPTVAGSVATEAPGSAAALQAASLAEVGTAAWSAPAPTSAVDAIAAGVLAGDPSFGVRGVQTAAPPPRPVLAAAAVSGGSVLLAVSTPALVVGAGDVSAWNGTARGRNGSALVIAASAAATTTTTAPPPPRVVAIGDSVMLGAQAALEARFGRQTHVDAKVSRQLSAAVEIVRTLRRQRDLGDVVVVHMGTNGSFTADQFEQLMTELRDVPRVVVVNTHVPRRWEAVVNGLIDEGVPRWPNAVLADWHTLGNKHPEWFWDGTHVGAEGAAAYAELIARAVDEP